MEKKEYQLTKEILDSVRSIEGFPIGSDANIIALSDPPYYTACPNPFIKDYFNKHNKKYDPLTDDYNKEPFSSDVSEGKSDIVYKSHSYLTQSPYRAILKYILHYTSKGDIVYDGFCGTGMTGLAAQICGTSDVKFKSEIEEELGTVDWGYRRAILCDLSPLATFMAYNYNKNVNYKLLKKEINDILRKLEDECSWVYDTVHNVDEEFNEVNLLGTKKVKKGTINYVVWSEVFSCPVCSHEILYMDVVIDEKSKENKKEFNCPKCDSKLTRNDLNRNFENFYNEKLKKVKKIVKTEPVLIYYNVDGNRTNNIKKPDEFDIETIKKINDMEIKSWYPFVEFKRGVKTQEPINLNINYTFEVYTKRNLFVLSKLYELIKQSKSSALLSGFLSSLPRASKRNRYIPKYGNRHVGTLSNALYFPPLFEENNIIKAIKYRFNQILKLYKTYNKLDIEKILITTQSSSDITQIPENSIDYIFTDPPFGSNLMYSELNFVKESWLEVRTNNKEEAIINPVQKKGLVEYQNIMELCFKENSRILKPNRWITVEFHNTSNKVWASIQEALMRAGFVPADVRILDKKKGTINQLSFSSGTVKQDLIISAYKPSQILENKLQYENDLNLVWSFIKDHLKKLPIFIEKEGVVELIIERHNYLLYDRLVAFYVQRGIAVPISASEFYSGLKTKYPERDGMYFLPEQVVEYDSKRMKSKRLEQSYLTVHDEKSAIQWLRKIISEKAKTYQEIQPEFLQSLYKNKYEELPELKELLEQNFVQDENGKWCIPDPNKDIDLEKLRIRALLNEYQDYVNAKGKLGIFRSEAIRAGFSYDWQNNDYESIIKVAEKLPTDVLQEDPTLLMYYDNALARTG
ncbi:MAG: DNA methyltransferase [Candidatus Ranarchaeia archaeon]